MKLANVKGRKGAGFSAFKVEDDDEVGSEVQVGGVVEEERVKKRRRGDDVG